MKQYAKLRRTKFEEAVREELLTIEEFSNLIGTNASYISRIGSESPSSCRCTLKFARRILQGFNGKYMFKDLFYWVQ